MSDVMMQTDLTAAVVAHRDSLVVRRIADDLSWGEGTIQPSVAHKTPAAEAQLVTAFLESIEPVAESEDAYTSCTDGRLPLGLANGDKMPVREQLVGADIVSGFHVAECLGAKFYRSPTVQVSERVADVAAFLHENGWLPSSHMGCGAADGFVGIVQNIIRFSQNFGYIERLKALLPEGVFDRELHDRMLEDMQRRLQAGVYQGLDGHTFLEAAEKTSGQRAIAELRDDGRGVHGHVEEAVVRLYVPGQAINMTALAAKTDERQVFGVNDTRMQQLARMFARGKDQDYLVAAMALEDFASGGHGTLAKNLPTYLVTNA